MALCDVLAVIIYLPCVPFHLIRTRSRRREERQKERARQFKSQIHIGNDIISDGCSPYEDVKEPCGKCSQIVIHDLTSRQGYLHYDNYEDLHRASLGGCKLCTILLLAIERQPGNRLIESWREFNSARGARPTLKLIACQENNGIKSDLLELRLERTISISTETFMVKDTLARIGLYAVEGTPAASLVPGRRISLLSYTETARCSLESWVRRTLEEDDRSREASWGSSVLPKRVLDVFDTTLGANIALVEHHEPKHDRYICLSHCWGRQSHLRLTRETLPQMKAGLKISKLAKNFQDAILITRLLGIRFLWIDALCILQDSQLDWEVESAKMGQYYKNSWLTISAGMSGDGTEGLLGKRSTHGLSHIRLKTSSNHHVFIALDPIKPSTQCPIRTRGWTFQEELLPRRYLSFEMTQTYLRCGTILHHECGRQEDLLRVGSPFMEGQHLLESGEWLEILRRYSSRNLTKPSDKLPALSGLAHEYQMRWGDEYLAGLWREHLWKGLLWRRNEQYTIPEPKRPLEYRAPSWSWASMDGRIHFDTHLEGSMSLVDIKSASTMLSGQDPMGQVSSGIIELTGVVVKMNLNGYIPEHLQIQLRKIYDVPGEIRPESPVRDQWLLWITKTSGLILRLSLDPVQNSIYERIGYFSSPRSMELDALWSRVKWHDWSMTTKTIYPRYISII